MSMVYDVSHDLAKFEEYNVEGRVRKLCFHGKGSTRAFGPGHPELRVRYRSTGQPVLIPGSMGSSSFVVSQPRLLAEEAPYAYKDVTQMVKAFRAQACLGRWRACGRSEW